MPSSACKNSNIDPAHSKWAGYASIYWSDSNADGRQASIFFNDTATTEIYTLSLHDALSISFPDEPHMTFPAQRPPAADEPAVGFIRIGDRKSTRLNSSHLVISYAVFCL